MIQEDYVSFEVAKLLKEKGFDEPCFYYYKDKVLMFSPFLKGRNSYQTDTYSAPTHQMAISWLREVYGLHIWVEYSRFDFNKEHPYLWNIVETKIDGDYWEGTYNKFPENAVESALNYALENLI